ncbi:trypsin-7 [Aplysia californica]|uniref:Trypsin-7 n=1 Tax=Aplysia californica TaxID=6500 RepID=A0ABM0ZUC5_APLCA|nr:trypsin-7 [Aplysia californica]
MSGWVIFVALVAVIGCTAAVENRAWSNCGNRNIANNGQDELNAVARIVGGQEAKRNSWGHQCSLMIFSNHHCGGSLVRNSAGRWFFVTAAHCTSGIHSAFFTARCGSHTTSGGTVIEFSTKTEHEKYNDQNLDYDIAVFQVSTSLEQTDKIWPICLPSRNANEGEKGIVTGWGAIYQDGPTSTALLQAVVPVKSNTLCSERYSNYDITNRMLCAGYTDGKKDACQADSGGGLNFLRNNKWELGAQQKSCGDGRVAKQQVWIHWELQSQTCTQAAQGDGSLSTELKQQWSSAAPWVSEQPFLGFALLTS